MSKKPDYWRSGIVLALALGIVWGLMWSVGVQFAMAQADRTTAAFAYLKIFEDDGSLSLEDLNALVPTRRPAIYVPPRPLVRSSFRPPLIF